MTDVVAGAGSLPAPAGADGRAPALPLAQRSTVEEFQRIYEENFRDLSGYCAAMLGDDQLAVDCAQEAFTRLFSRLRAVRDPRSWLFLVATNLVRDEWREQARRRRAAAQMHLDAERTVPARDVSMTDLVTRLPKRLAEVVVLHYFADLSVQEVARVTGVPLGTAKRRLHEARNLLLAAMEER